MHARVLERHQRLLDGGVVERLVHVLVGQQLLHLLVVQQLDDLGVGQQALDLLFWLCCRLVMRGLLRCFFSLRDWRGACWRLQEHTLGFSISFVIIEGWPLGAAIVACVLICVCERGACGLVVAAAAAAAAACLASRSFVEP